jgi:hypothetical protein
MKTSVAIAVAGAYLIFMAGSLGICMGAKDYLSAYVTVELGFAGCKVVKP